jgi:hypothetical protein
VRQAFSAHAFARQQNFGAKAAHLLVRALGQLGAADTGRKAQIILDPRAAAGLATERVALDQHGLQPFGGTVDGGAQTGRAGAVDRQVVFGTRGIAEPAELLGDLPNRWTLQAGAIREEAHRQARVRKMFYAGVRAGLRIGRQLHPCERHIAAVQEVANRVAQRRTRWPEDCDQWHRGTCLLYHHRSLSFH